MLLHTSDGRRDCAGRSSRQCCYYSDYDFERLFEVVERKQKVPATVIVHANTIVSRELWVGKIEVLVHTPHFCKHLTSNFQLKPPLPLDLLWRILTLQEHLLVGKSFEGAGSFRGGITRRDDLDVTQGACAI